GKSGTPAAISPTPGISAIDHLFAAVSRIHPTPRPPFGAKHAVYFHQISSGGVADVFQSPTGCGPSFVDFDRARPAQYPDTGMGCSYPAVTAARPGRRA